MGFGARIIGRAHWRQRGGTLALALLVLGAVACSAVVKNGEHRVYSVPKFGRHNPNIEVIGIRSGIHDLHLQSPGDVSRIVLRFLGTSPADGVLARSAAVPGEGRDASPGRPMPGSLDGKDLRDADRV